MSRVLSASLFLAVVSAASPAAAEIKKIFIYSPEEGIPEEDSLEVDVVVESTFEVKQVTAEVEGIQFPLAWVGGKEFAGTCDITALSWGNHLLTVTATDVFGNTGAKTVSFKKDKPPEIVVYSPTYGTVANPFVHVHADCFDDGPGGCEEFQANAFISGSGGEYLYVASGIDHLDMDESLEKLDGNRVVFTFWAQDTSGLITSIYFPVYVDSSPNLVPVDSIPAGEIVDFDEKRILFNAVEKYTWDITTNPQTPKDPKMAIYDRATGEVKVLGEGVCLQDLEFTTGTCALTSHGAIFFHYGSFAEYRPEWPEYKLYGTDVYSGSLKVAGDFAIFYESKFKLYRANLSTGEEVLVAEDAPNMNNEVAGNGDVLYTSIKAEGGIKRFRDGIVSQLFYKEGWTAGSPLTDGKTVVFKSCTMGKCGYQALLQSGDMVQLSLNVKEGWQPLLNHRINDGWIAYAEIGATGTKQVWLRSPGGKTAQISKSAANNLIYGLSSDGEVVYQEEDSPGLMFRANMCSPPAKMCRLCMWGEKKLGGAGYMFIGRSVFKIGEAGAECTPGWACDDGVPDTTGDQCVASGKCWGLALEDCDSPFPDGKEDVVDASEMPSPDNAITEQAPECEVNEDVVVADAIDDSSFPPEIDGACWDAGAEAELPVTVEAFLDTTQPDTDSSTVTDAAVGGDVLEDDINGHGEVGVDGGPKQGKTGSGCQAQGDGAAPASVLVTLFAVVRGMCRRRGAWEGTSRGRGSEETCLQ